MRGGPPGAGRDPGSFVVAPGEGAPAAVTSACPSPSASALPVWAAACNGVSESPLSKPL